MPGQVAVHVGARVPGQDALEAGGLLHGAEPLAEGEQRFAQHAHVAVAPVLNRDPLRHVVEVVLHLLPEEVPLAGGRVTGAAGVGVHEHVAAGHEVVDVAGLPHVEDGEEGEVDEVLLVGVGRV